MGIIDTLVNSAVTVFAFILGFGLLMTGGQQAATGSGGMGTVIALVGIILLVFGARL
jgi:hypothetical protein